MKWFLVLALVACGHPAAHDHVVTPPPATDDPSCPLVIPGTSVTVEDTTDGAALVFVTTGDVANVRVRARFLALSRTQRETEAPAGHDHHGDTLSEMIETQSTADETDIDHGARVAFKATKPEDVSALQAELRMHAAHLTGDTCKMAM